MKEKQNVGELITPEEAAKVLGVRPGTLAVWRTRSINLPFHKIGRAVRYKLADVIEFAEKGYVPNA